MKNLFSRNDIKIDMTPEYIKEHDEYVENQIRMRREWERRYAFESSGVPEDMFNATFKNFYVKTDILKKILLQVYGAYERLAAGEYCNIILYGNPGTGKTHLVSALLKALIYARKKSGMMTTQNTFQACIQNQTVSQQDYRKQKTINLVKLMIRLLLRTLHQIFLLLMNLDEIRFLVLTNQTACSLLSTRGNQSRRLLQSVRIAAGMKLIICSEQQQCHDYCNLVL